MKKTGRLSFSSSPGSFRTCFFPLPVFETHVIVLFYLVSANTGVGFYFIVCTHDKGGLFLKIKKTKVMLTGSCEEFAIEGENIAIVNCVNFRG